MQSVPEYRFTLTRIFPYKNKIADFVFIREKLSQTKPKFRYILHSVTKGVARKSSKMECFAIWGFAGALDTHSRKTFHYYQGIDIKQNFADLF